MNEATQKVALEEASQSQGKRSYLARAYAAGSRTSGLTAATIPRRELGPEDVRIEILYCGICHSDLHSVRNEWSGVMPTVYPIVPGHEIVGRVTKVGSAVTKFKPGDLAAVGCLVDSDCTCPECGAGLEQFCPNLTLTFNSPDKHLGGVTYGGYSESIVVDQRFVLRVPSNLNPAGAAPLLCAGITTYSPMRHWGIGKGQKVGVVGLGGLGHMAVKFAHALGARVVVFTTSPNKKEDALRLGADGVVVSRNASVLSAKQMGAKRIIAMSRHESRQRLAREFGATEIVTERGDEGVARIKELTDGIGADSVLECVGTQESMMQAISSARKGGYVSYVGVPHGVELNGEKLFYAHVHLHGGPAPVRRYLPELIKLVWNRKINPGKVFDLTLPLDQVAEGYRAMDERRAIKTLLRPQGDSR